jgi:hypothetical protein
LLFQPSELIPSSFGVSGSDVIDATEPNTFSLTVNGTSTVGAYRASIYENTASSTSVYDSGVIVLSEAFMPTSYDGSKNRFEITIPSNDAGLSSHTSMVNEFVSGYKWTITLWEVYDSEDPTSTAITSAENFIKTKIPSTVAVDPSTAPSTITSRANLWKATLTSTSSVKQFRWFLAESTSGGNTIIYTSEFVNQTPQIWFRYDGLTSGKSYSVRVQVVTQDGVSCYSAWAASAVSYTTLVATGTTTVTAVAGGIQVGWSDIQYIEGASLYIADDTASLHYTITSDYPTTGQDLISIDDDTYIKFSSSATFDLVLDDEGTLVVCLYPDGYSGASVPFVKSESDDESESRELSHAGYVAGLFPSDTLYPSDSLYPSAGSQGAFSYVINGVEHTYVCQNEFTLTKFVIRMGPSGMSVCEYARE